MSDHSPQHTTTGPLAVPMNGNIPAGWVSPDVAGAAEREIDRQAILTEQEQAANAAVEAEISRRMNTVKTDVTEDEVNNGE